MTNTLIYIFGEGISIKINELQEILRKKFSLLKISEEDDEKMTYKGYSVSELLFSKNLDYIKIDAQVETFISLVYVFAILLRTSKSKHIYAFGLSGDPLDYNDLPFFENENECMEWLSNS